MKYAAMLLLLITAGNAQTVHKKVPKQDPNRCNADSMSSYGDGWHQYHCVPDAADPTGWGHWEEDKVAEQVLWEQEQHKDNLVTAFTTRVLTQDEMKEVLRTGPSIFIHNGQTYFQKDIDQQFLVALEIQHELRLMADDEKKAAKP